MEVPRLGVKSEMQLPATATATRDLSHICDLYHSSQQHQIPNLLSEGRDQILVLMDTSQVHYCWAIAGTPDLSFKVYRKKKRRSYKQKYSNNGFYIYLLGYLTTVLFHHMALIYCRLLSFCISLNDPL